MRNTLIITLLAFALSACGGKEKETAGDLDHYFAIKDALVKTDAIASAQAAKSYLAVNTNASLKTSLQMISGSLDVDYQRKAFEQLSKDLYQFVKTNDIGITIYKQYCPMAFNYKGAYWLAKEQRVNNPYFGDLMLHCGHVDEVITQ